MNLKSPHFSTIIIVDKTKDRTRSLNINTKHINRLRHYAFSILFVFTVLLITVFYLGAQNRKAEAEKQLLMARLAKMQHTLPATDKQAAAGNAGAASSARTYIQAIEAKLKKINDYLRKRGLPEFSIKAIGGSGKPDDLKLSANEQYSLYNDYLTHLLNNVAYTPMGYPRVSGMSSIFGYRSDPFNTEHAEYHPGIDFKGQKGDPVKCTANGVVTFAGWHGGYGNCIIIKHQNNFETLFGHLSHIDVKVGKQVSVGDVIGRVGSTGHSTGSHLHYEVRVNGKPVNPVKFLTLNH